MFAIRINNTAISVPLVITLLEYKLEAMLLNPHYGKVPSKESIIAPYFLFLVIIFHFFTQLMFNRL